MNAHSLLDEDHERRFGGLDRLYGDGARLVLHESRVAVVGVGGVGSWAAEALARSGIGHLTLIDMDHVAISNVNRQIHALQSTLGKAKALVLNERIRDINPSCTVTVIDDFLTEDNLAELIPPGTLDTVIDSCDSAKVKASLIVHAKNHAIRLLVCGATGGKDDPLKLRVDDLGKSTHDALLARTRDKLRNRRHILPRRNGKYGVDCIFLDTPAHRDASCSASNLGCAGFGSIVTVTASMGLAAASFCINHLIAQHKQHGGTLESKPHEG